MAHPADISDQALKEAFGARVRELRDLANMSRDQLGERIGKSRESVERIERGTGVVRLPDLFRLAAVFDISLDDLLDVADQPAHDTEKRRALRDLIKTVRHEDPAFVKRLTKVARVFQTP